MSSSQPDIHIQGARVHNLRGIDVRIRRGALTVLTGVSGSGKSSLAFDTLYAEGYRKYMESLSTQARQMLDQLPRPEVDFIHGLSPVLAIEQRESGASPRTTVATETEIADYARLLWLILGEQFCPKDGGRIVANTLDACVDRILALPAGTRVMILAPVLKAKVSVLREELMRLRQRGFQRIRLGGELRLLDDNRPLPSGNPELTVELVIDRIVVAADQRSRLADSLELAFREGADRALCLHQPAGADRDAAWAEMPLSRSLACEICGEVYEPLTARHFSFNHSEGACPDCGGLGYRLQFDERLVVPDTSLSVRNGAIKPLRFGGKAVIIRNNTLLKQLAEQLPFDLDQPWSKLPGEIRDILLHGAGDRMFTFRLKARSAGSATRFPGVLALLEEARRSTRSEGFKARLTTFQSTAPCQTCNGHRLHPRSASVLVDGMPITRFFASSIREALGFVQGVITRHKPGGLGSDTLGEVLASLQSRLSFLTEVGLDYLTLDREAGSLSGGEAQRLRLATQLGMGLVGVTYVLDEPSIGLHPSDNDRLIATLKALRDRGNTLVVVEHDEDTIRAADEIIELGPDAGEAGGHLIFQGTPEACAAAPASRSRTGPYLAGHYRVERNSKRLKPDDRWVEVLGASENNLAQVDARFPVGLLSVVTGVSGSGKSSLVNDILARAAQRELNGAKCFPGKHRAIRGLEHFEKCVVVDQDPIGRSPRSNPATFTGLFDHLRDLFAQLPLARVRGYNASRFSFNTRGGRCERCQGDGLIKLDMQFLSDAYVVCPSCNGKRYNRETLEIRFAGRTIADVLEMSISDAAKLFKSFPKLAERLNMLDEVGLGYLRLGQPATTLSGGEAQRLKLSLELAKRQQGVTLYLLDEPTTGLHWVDIQRLADVLFRLRDAGNTVIVIEHNLDLMALADWIVDLGPGGGPDGGRIVGEGPPEKIIERTDTPTGRVLARKLSRV